MKTELDRTKEALEVAKEMVRSLSFTSTSIERMAKIDAILNPPPATEEVEVTVWALLDKNYEVYGTSSDEPNCPSDPCIKLTGVYTRPVPQKVERSVSVKAMIGDGVAYTKGAGIGLKEGGRTQLIEFADLPECHGKRGTLTFTWHE